MIEDVAPDPAGVLERAESRADELIAFARARFGDEGAAGAMLVAAARMVAIAEGDRPDGATAAFAGLVALYGAGR